MLTRCTDCKGRGTSLVHWHNYDYTSHSWYEEPCSRCSGTGFELVVVEDLAQTYEVRVDALEVGAR